MNQSLFYHRRRCVSGYINGNLLKHREVSTFKELENNQFSSHWHFKEVYGDEEAQNAVRSMIDLDEDSEGNIDLKELSKVKIASPCRINKPQPWAA